MDNVAIEIKLPKGIKRSWSIFKDILKDGGYNVDLRKSSKTCVPFYLKTDCCGSELEIRRIKDFPLKDKKCKCGNRYLIKWEEKK